MTDRYQCEFCQRDGWRGSGEKVCRVVAPVRDGIQENRELLCVDCQTILDIVTTKTEAGDLLGAGDVMHDAVTWLCSLGTGLSFEEVERAFEYQAMRSDDDD